jgi:hypothetical protein
MRWVSCISRDRYIGSLGGHVNTSYGAAWIAAFLVTQAIEMPLYRMLAPVSWWYAASMSTVTHPLVWFIIPPLCYSAGCNYLQMIITAELFAWSVEAAMLRGFGVRWPRAVATSLVANAASVVIGLTTRAWFGFP